MRLEWILGGVGIWILGVVAAALSKVLADEFKAWRPCFTKWIIRCAVAGLPEDQRERFEEEWASHIEDDAIPGEIGKILAAVGFILAAKRKSCDIKESSALPGSRGYRKNREIIEAYRRLILSKDAATKAIAGNATCRMVARGVLTVTGRVSPRLFRECAKCGKKFEVSADRDRLLCNDCDPQTGC